MRESWGSGAQSAWADGVDRRAFTARQSGRVDMLHVAFGTDGGMFTDWTQIVLSGEQSAKLRTHAATRGDLECEFDGVFE